MGNVKWAVICARQAHDHLSGARPSAELASRERRFQILVLANLCAVIARELRAGQEPSLEDTRLFVDLLGEEGGADPRDAAALLARLIRAGELDASLDQAIVSLRG